MCVCVCVCVLLHLHVMNIQQDTQSQWYLLRCSSLPSLLSLSPPLFHSSPLPSPSFSLSLTLPPQTGTLTQNVMTFLKCSIQGVKYGELSPDDKEKEEVVATGEVLQRQKSVSRETYSVTKVVCLLIHHND